MRAFIAISVSPTPELKHLRDQLAGMGRGVKAVEPGNLHLTLRFFGEIDALLTPTIAKRMDQALAALPSLEIPLVGIGAYPHAHRPSVIWVGIANPAPLITLAQSLDDHLADLELPPRDKPFTAHLTLARIKTRPPQDLFDLLKTRTNTSFGAQPVASIALIESELTREGPIYRDLHVTRLAA